MIHEATLNTDSVARNLIPERSLFSVAFGNTGMRDYTIWQEHHLVPSLSNRLIWAGAEVLSRVWDDRITLKK